MTRRPNFAVRYSNGGWVGPLRSIAKGATFAFNDEIEAGLRALAQLDPDAYQREVARIRAQQKAYEDANPLASLGYEAGGAMLTGLIPGAQGATAGRLASLAARAPGAARVASLAVRNPRAAELARIGVESAAYGVGAADSMADIPRSVGEEAAFGAGLYGLGAGTRAGYRRLRRKK